MLSRNDQPLGFNFNFARDSLFNKADNSGVVPTPSNSFLLLDGTPMLLLDGTFFLLLE